MIVTLLTDFGLTDQYVAAMKGVILSHAPAIRLVDITHEVPPYDIERAAYLLAGCYREFPPGTVHLVVVDPGVGSDRHPLAINAAGQYFVGPDNGVFSPVLGRGSEVRRLRDEPVGGVISSRTFQGRDLFAPAAARLASGAAFPDEGPLLTEFLVLPSWQVERRANGSLAGRIIHVDRFGNCVSSLRPEHFPGTDWQSYRFELCGETIHGRRTYYSEGGDLEPFVILGSGGYLEISLDRDSAAARLRGKTGDSVLATPGEG